MLKILFVHAGMPTFARTDFEILSEVHDVRALDFPGPRSGWVHVAGRLPALRRGVEWADLTFSWFGKLHAFFAVLFCQLLGKKSAVVVSGGEVCRFSLGPGNVYGSICTHPVKKWFPRFVAKYGDLLMPVSEYAYSEAIQSVRGDPRRMRLIHHGFDTEFFRREPGKEKQALVLTVAELMADNYYRKRLGTLLDAARTLADVPFVIVGRDYDGTGQRLRKIAPANVHFTGRISDEALVDLMGKASVYIQPSTMESFGCALAEAMLCECVPVVTCIPALKEVVGDCGVFLDDPVTADQIADKVQLAMQHSELGRRARRRVIDNFSLERRQTHLLAAVSSLAIGQPRIR